MKTTDKKNIPRIIILISIVLIGYWFINLAGHAKTSNSPINPPISEEKSSNIKALEANPNNPNSQSTSNKNNISTANSINKTKHHQGSHNSPTLKASPAHPQIPYYLLGTTNDPQLPSTWFHSKIQTNRAWDLTTGSSSVTVAVIDTGFELNHEDLSNKWFQNANEMGMTQVGDFCWTGESVEKSTNNCDDDQNGYVDDWRGYDFFYVDNNPQAGQVNPTGEGTRHATMVSGAIGAIANNSLGSVGVDQQAKILPLQVFSDDGEAYTDDIASAIDYATDMNANVINLSLGANQYDGTLLSTIDRAINNGTLVVASSGNCALNDEDFCHSLTPPGRMVYPALYPEVLAVGATDINDQRSDFSSYGAQLDLVAPGSAISPLPVYNNGSLNSYATAYGTSFSSPIVAGIASLLIAQNPSITVSQLITILTSSTDTTANMNSQTFTDEYGFGRANAHKATLLGLAKTQTSLLGEEFPHSDIPPVANIWRSSSSPIANDEWLLFGCRVYLTDYCTITLTNGPAKYTANNSTKGDEIKYIFIKGSALNSGLWQASAHSNDFASQVTTLTKN